MKKYKILLFVLIPFIALLCAFLLRSLFNLGGIEIPDGGVVALWAFMGIFLILSFFSFEKYL